jgi:hypothetical protein
MIEWVTANDVSRETWRRLREFANVDIAADAIAAVHGPPTPKTQDNYKKQARQIRASILQAAEYFDAAHSTSLFTRPNHLYYGLASLASSMILLLGDGSRSFDALRKDTRNMRHGLAFTTTSTSRTASVGLNLLEEGQIAIQSDGHFANWYSLLPRDYPVAGRIHTPRRVEIGIIGNQPKPEFAHFSGSKQPLMSSMKYLPDLYPDLRRYGVPIAASRVSKELVFNDRGRIIHCAVHGASSQKDLEVILERFLFDMDSIPDLTYEMAGNGIALRVRIPEGKVTRWQWPDSRVDMTGEEWMYAADVSAPEIVDLYLSAYGLSMLCRYYPDLWFSCLDSNCKAAQLVDAWTNVAVNKSPMLALSILSRRPVIISTQRPPIAHSI